MVVVIGAEVVVVEVVGGTKAVVATDPVFAGAGVDVGADVVSVGPAVPAGAFVVVGATSACSGSEL